MKLEVTYSHKPDLLPFDCWARSETFGLEACGSTYNEATERLRQKIRAKIENIVPDPVMIEVEVIEIELKG